MDSLSQRLFKPLATILGVFVLVEVNYPHLTPQAQLASYALLGLSLVYLRFPLFRHWRRLQWLDLLPLVGVVYCFGYILLHNTALFSAFWPDNRLLGHRAGMETINDNLVGALGLLLVLEATRRCIGSSLPLLAITFLAYAILGPVLPDWLFPHRGYSWERIVSQTFLHSQGVFGIALKVMFSYVFLFVLFGAVLERTGATNYIINLAQRIFYRSTGGPAKVAVVASSAFGTSTQKPARAHSSIASTARVMAASSPLSFT